MRKLRTAMLALVGGVLIAAGGFLYVRSDMYCDRHRSCRQLRQVEQLVDLYLLENGSLPSKLEDLFSLNDPQKPWAVRTSDFIDSWGHRIRYTYGVTGPNAFRVEILAANQQADGRGPPGEIVRDCGQVLLNCSTPMQSIGVLLLSDLRG